MRGRRLFFLLCVMTDSHASCEHSKKSTLSGRIRLREKCLQAKFFGMARNERVRDRQHKKNAGKPAQVFLIDTTSIEVYSFISEVPLHSTTGMQRDSIFY